MGRGWKAARLGRVWDSGQARVKKRRGLTRPAKPRYVFSQWQHLTGNDFGQLENPKHDVVVWPKAYATGNLIFPYTDALK